jgi:hypothetical protein
MGGERGTLSHAKTFMEIDKIIHVWLSWSYISEGGCLASLSRYARGSDASWSAENDILHKLIQLEASIQ